MADAIRAYLNALDLAQVADEVDWPNVSQGEQTVARVLLAAMPEGLS